jgi:hypothetical protein
VVQFCFIVNVLLKIFNNCVLGTRFAILFLEKTARNRIFKKALDLASVCEHPNAIWLTKLFAGRGVDSRERGETDFSWM